MLTLSFSYSVLSFLFLPLPSSCPSHYVCLIDSPIPNTATTIVYGKLWYTCWLGLMMYLMQLIYQKALQKVVSIVHKLGSTAFSFCSRSHVSFTLFVIIMNKGKTDWKLKMEKKTLTAPGVKLEVWVYYSDFDCVAQMFLCHCLENVFSNSIYNSM